MINYSNKEKIVVQSKIFDLHIHTNLCSVTNDFTKKYNDNYKGFVDDLLKLYSSSKNKPSMISFTDHNKISQDVYHYYWSKESDIVLMPGVEIDFEYGDEKDYKHLIVYFDITTIEEFDDLSTKINDLLKDALNDVKRLKLPELLTSLLELNYKFIISPHVFKQGKRSIDVNWVFEEELKKNIDMYADQFFVFWESAGSSSIAKANEFIKEYDKEERISIVNFSDSKSFNDLKQYLDNPPILFNCLPTFKGLALSGTDIYRIIPPEKTQSINENKKTTIIKQVDINGQVIEFSPKLNAIIGGRGSGKSILIDAIANKFNEEIADKERLSFINNFSIIINDYNNRELDAFNIEYYPQAYSAKVFKSKEINKTIREMFAKEFNNIEDIDERNIINDIKNSFNELYVSEELPDATNMGGIYEKFNIIKDDSLNIRILAADTKPIPQREDLISYEDALRNFNNKFDSSIVSQIRESEIIKTMKNLMRHILVEESKRYNENLIKTKYASKIFFENVKEYKDGLSSEHKNKTEVTKELTTEIHNKTFELTRRYKIMNSYIKMMENFQNKYANYNHMKLNSGNTIIYCKELKIETPLDHFEKVFDEFVDGNKINASSSLKTKVSSFLNDGENILKLSKTYEVWVNTLEKFEIVGTSKNKVYYFDGESTIDLETESPGTQTNILMEYIVNSDSELLLIIDQPEDNVDNETISREFKEWFRTLKNKRQVFVVTHDANIAINADAENIIIAEQTKPRIFNYTYGSMEYGNNLERSSNILDGGIEAVKRRIMKYEVGKE